MGYSEDCAMRDYGTTLGNIAIAHLESPDRLGAEHGPYVGSRYFRVALHRHGGPDAWFADFDREGWKHVESYMVRPHETVNIYRRDALTLAMVVDEAR